MKNQNRLLAAVYFNVSALTLIAAHNTPDWFFSIILGFTAIGSTFVGINLLKDE